MFAERLCQCIELRHGKRVSVSPYSHLLALCSIIPICPVPHVWQCWALFYTDKTHRCPSCLRMTRWDKLDQIPILSLINDWLNFFSLQINQHKMLVLFKHQLRFHLSPRCLNFGLSSAFQQMASPSLQMASPSLTASPEKGLASEENTF